MSQDHDTDRWGTDGFFFTEAARGGPLVWRVGDMKLEGDALGPVRHAHDDAGEYFYMFRGGLRIEVGGEEFVLAEGELVAIPPDIPHNVLGPAIAGEESQMFCLIGPNLVSAKWRLEDFKPGSESLGYEVARPFHDAELPSAGTLSAEALSLTRDDAPVEERFEGRECVYLVVEGALDIALWGGLHGTIERGTYVHVREGIAHELSTQTEAKVLRMDCGFVLWAGVALADDVESAD